MNLNNRFKDAMTNSLELVERGLNVDGLELLDEAIRKRFEMMTFDRHARCAITQLTSRDLTEIGRQLHAITHNPLPATLKMPELCMDWQRPRSMKAIPLPRGNTRLDATRPYFAATMRY